MKLNKCSREDLDDLISIGRETYYDTFHSMNSAETMEQYLNEAFHRERIASELANPNSAFYLLYDKGDLAAYMKVNRPPAQSDLNDPESLELERIYVRKAHKGSGYGKHLIEKALSLAGEKGSKYLWLGVWEKNEKALGFYRKMGFEIFDTHPFRMGDEIQTDYLMRRFL